MSCSECGLQKICFPKNMIHTDVIQLEKIVDSQPVLDKGSVLFSKGDTFSSLYAVKSGVIKVFSADEKGGETIHEFYMPGDVVGLEAVSSKVYACNAVAIDSSSVCEIKIAQIEKLSSFVPSLNNHMLELMGQEIYKTRSHARLLTQKTAEQRVAYFILTISDRFKNNGYQYNQFRLDILHKDIANYLNLTPETVSRVLTKFADNNLVT